MAGPAMPLKSLDRRAMPSRINSTSSAANGMGPYAISSRSCPVHWNQDGVILFGSIRGIMRVNAAGGKPELVTRFDSGKGEVFHSWPSLLPDGDHFLYTVSAPDAENRGAYVGSLSAGPPRRILPDEANAQYSPMGYLVFNRANNLLAQRLDATRLQLSGEPFVIAQRVATIANFAWGALSTAGSSLVYRAGSGLSVTQMERRDRKGNKLGTIGPAADLSTTAKRSRLRRIAGEAAIFGRNQPAEPGTRNWC
jgi:eukaryotic-like serine/threonine-protein kinase